MAEDVGGIVWTADINTQKLTQSERKATRSVGNVEKGFERTERSGQRLNTTVTKLAASIGSVFAVRQMQRYITSTAAAIDEQGKFAQQLGISFEELQKLQFAAEQSGASITQMNNSLRRGRRNIAEAAQGTGSAADAIRDLGIEAKSLAALSPDQQFRAIADAISQVEDESRQAAIAYRIFGRDGEFLLNTLREGSDGLQRLGDDAERTGRILSQEAADNAAKFNDELNRLSGAVGGVVKGIGAELLPVMADVMEVMTGFVSDGERVEKVLNLIGIAAASTAAIVTARFVGSLVTSAAAMVSAQIQSARYQAALASMAGVSRTSAAGQLALARAVGVSRGAMTLLGGKAGAIFLVISALAFFISRAKEAGDASDILSQSTDDLTEAKARLAQLETEEALERERRRLVDLQRDIENATQRWQEFGQGSNQNIRKQRELGEEIRRMRAELASGTEDAGALEQRLGELADIIAGRAKPQMDELGGSAGRTAGAVRNVLNEIEAVRRNMAAGFEAGDDPFGDPDAFDEAVRQRLQQEQELRQQIRQVGVSETERQLVEYEGQVMRELQILRDGLEQKLIEEEEYEERRLALSEQYTERRQEILAKEGRSFGDRMKEMGVNFEAMQSQAVGSLASMATGFQSSSDAARQFAQMAAQQVVGALIRMAIQAVAAQKMVDASAATSAATISSAYATPAALVSLASFGANAVPAQAGIAATVASTNALAIGTGRQHGGKVEPGTMYPVAEDGRSEVLQENGRQYLLPGARGEVISNRDMSTTNSGDTIHLGGIHFTGAAANSREEFEALLFDHEEEVYNMVRSAKNRRGETF